MSFPVHCPLCGRSGRVPLEQRSKCVRCPRCRHTFRAEPDTEELAGLLLETRKDDVPESRRPDDDLPL